MEASVTMRFRHREHPCITCLAGLLLALFVANQSAKATVFPYGNFVGTDVEYFNVSESPTKVPAPSGFPYPLFNPPTIVGDNLEFSPTDFNATSTGGSFPLTDSQLSTNIMTLSPSNAITSMVIKEGGSYSLIGGSANTQAIVSMNVVIARILEVNGAPIAPINVTASIVYNNLGSAASSVVSNELIMNNSIVQPPPINQAWNASATFDFDAALAQNGIEGHATDIQFAMDNTLSATSEVVNGNPTTAYIDKKDFHIELNDPVPEPAAVTLAVVGAFGLAVFGFRNRRRALVLSALG
jgi:hypothetical protein